ncbi:MAG: type II secretion system F domain protein, tight adherence protein B [Candidatus Peregrinibacteria bacterium GW2011_GWF2_33_10]|nr:MAG: type II secretion system F domain protein, tight adherence protein B [Candidatus Peregrinibacteria bacterium GW2011_GWF2_33_10]OGJ44505.1 MAG: hypothetical protein A2263_05645 [Candidatus Peregrinibacteria bacterium RIFOXYA2_FULL_33_21]OGJ50313.1 MAG: hypothetical protein A2307_06225 [Candidatus Peregrinibacteria bacterium RIFOXYB2_FULL_33_20]
MNLENANLFIAATLISIIVILRTISVISINGLYVKRQNKFLKFLFKKFNHGAKQNNKLNIFKKLDLFFSQYKFTKDLAKKYSIIDQKSHFSIFILIIILISIFAFIIARFMHIPSIYTCIISISILLSPKFIISFLYKKIQNSVNEQLPDMFDAMANTLQAGYSITQSIEFLSREIDYPLRYFLKSPTEKLKYNLPITEILGSLGQEIPLDDMKLFINAVSLQQDIGGNLVEMLQHISHSIRERLKIEKDVKSYTAQGRFSGLMLAGLGPLSLGAFWMVSSEYVKPLFNTNIGNFMLFMAIVLEIIGFFWIRKIIKIKI